MFGLALGQNVSFKTFFLTLSMIQILFSCLKDGPFKMKSVNGCPQIDKFATYSLNSLANGKMSPRIGILGASTFPSENDQYMSNSNLNASGQLNPQ